MENGHWNYIIYFSKGNTEDYYFTKENEFDFKFDIDKTKERRSLIRDYSLKIYMIIADYIGKQQQESTGFI